MDLIYIAKYPGSVFSSQVVEYLNHLALKKCINSITLVVGISVNKYKENIKTLSNININKDIRVIVFKFFPFYSMTVLFTQLSYMQALYRIGVNIVSTSKIHIRGEHLAFIHKRVCNILKIGLSNVLVDIRGASLEEFLYRGGMNRLLLYYKQRIRRQALLSLSHFSHITVVSKSLEEYILETTKYSNSTYITPCLASNSFSPNSNKREKIRAHLGIDNNEILFVFSSGGLQGWQGTEKIISEITQGGHKILNLSPIKINFPTVINSYVEHSLVNEYLSAADIAIIWRDKTIVNKVACPVKFTEYLCSGLPVIANDSVDSISELIKNRKVGILINNMSEITVDIINNLIKINRQRISYEGKTTYGIEAVSNSYMNIYSNVLSISSHKIVK